MGIATALAAFVFVAAVPGESLDTHLAPVRDAVAEVLATLGGNDAGQAAAQLEQAVERWETFVATAGTDTTDRPAGWTEDIMRLFDAFAAADDMASTEDVPGMLAALAVTAELLEWLPQPKPVVLKFTGYSCKGCKVMEGVLKLVADDYAGRAVVRTIDVNTEKELTKEYRVMLLPTMVFLDRGGTERFRVAREMTREEVADKLDVLLAGE